MLKSVRWAAKALVAGAVFVTASHAAELTIDTAKGPESVPATPARIAVFDIAAIDTLSALGVPIVGIPQPYYVAYLDDVAKSATPIGTLFEPDFEALANLEPDLIVAGGRSSSQVDALARIAPTVDMTIWGDDHISQALSRLDAYGKLMDLEEKAAELKADFEQKLATARAAIEGKGNALIILTNGPKISAYGAGSRFGWIHNELALPEAKEGVDAQTHGEAISFEFIAEVNPDWLIVIDRGAAIGAEGESAAETLDNELVRETQAWKNGHVVFVDAGRIYVAGGGIQAVSGTLDELIAAFGG
ncbi:siderophore ABC transporter substrate-binding protein [Pseudoruegeria marinistellae]|uniref:siderophore ABC transporter substrate-binding protein n=1 Tax=Tropicimonas marinistellae TaxID=1739787 RepID=UPI0008377A8C